TWDTFARAMCDRFHVVALDQRGHGDSDWARDAAYTPADHARDIGGGPDRLGPPPLLLIRPSIGGPHACPRSPRQPPKAEKLVIVDIGPDIGPRGASRVSRMAAEAPEDFGSVDEAVSYLQKYATTTSARAEASLRYRVERGIKKRPDGRYTWKYDRFLRDQ